MEISILQSQLEEQQQIIRRLETALSEAQMEKEVFGKMCNKQGRISGLRVGADLGFEKGYKAGYWSFLKGDDLKVVVESFREKTFNQMWH